MTNSFGYTIDYLDWTHCALLPKVVSIINQTARRSLSGSHPTIIRCGSLIIDRGELAYLMILQLYSTLAIVGATLGMLPAL